MQIIEIVLSIFVVIASLLGIVLVLLQSRSGAILFGDSGQNSIRADKKGDFFTKTTGILISIFLLGSLGLAYLRNSSKPKFVLPESDTFDTVEIESESKPLQPKATIVKPKSKTKTIKAKTVKPKPKARSVKKSINKKQAEN